MALSLLKLTMTASQPTTTADPTPSQFFYTSTGLSGSTSYTISDVDWVDDSGTAVTAGNLTTVSTDNGYSQVFINGQLQEGGITTSLSSTGLTITFDAVTDIDAGKIISLVVVNFAPSTTAPIITG